MLRVQELVRSLYRRPAVVESLKKSKPDRVSIQDLAEFLEWLWPLTAAPQRFLRGNAVWLHKHMSALYIGSKGLQGDFCGSRSMDRTCIKAICKKKSCVRHNLPCLPVLVSDLFSVIVG